MNDRTGEAPVLTIDGPGGSGKGTVGRRVAARLGWHFLDSGALYRVLALAARNRGIDLADATALAALARHLDVRFEERPADTEPAILLDGGDVTRAVRTEAAGTGASRVAALAAVRAALLERQRAFRGPPGLVADGRDMGTVVFPAATLKVFLDATPEERALRRYKQLMEKGIDANLSRLVEEIAERDARDRQRTVAPLVAAADAILVDTSGVAIVDVVNRVLELAAERLRA